ncbi:tRNA-splicing endonuclease subunit Sen34 isoform X1 [Esox lucius]|uniref:tRNA-splicing endonuclease subunit Sen34 n=1 Tax=Esox lucius TaxID=8010 RepID=A0AAY5L860_ESOLU|nr:tRNA-splicing endonuclease subunit Sen34 isoform X1 [Esox lucius]
MDLSEANITKQVSKDDAGEGSMARELIKINFCGSTPLLWRTEDLKAARELGFVGTLVGSLARQPRQNTRLGRPLELLLEEGRLMADMERAAVSGLDSKSEDPEVSPAVVEQYYAGLENSFQEQSALALEDRKMTLTRVLTEKQKEFSKGQEDADSNVRNRLEALDRSFSFPRTAMSVQLCTARAGLAHCPQERQFLTADWPMPQDERCKCRFQVFKDLRRRGFYLTSAGKFGGDYLVYPGDPLRFHAHFIAVCVSMDESMPLCDVLAIARLGSNVKKTVLLCSSGESQDDEREEVVYTSLQWSGMA